MKKTRTAYKKMKDFFNEKNNDNTEKDNNTACLNEQLKICAASNFSVTTNLEADSSEEKKKMKGKNE